MVFSVLITTLRVSLVMLQNDSDSVFKVLLFINIVANTCADLLSNLLYDRFSCCRYGAFLIKYISSSAADPKLMLQLPIFNFLVLRVVISNLSKGI